METVILFYSRHNLKSMKLRNMIENMNVDIQMICVDSADVRDRLLNDDKYSIKAVPTILTLYDTGQYMAYTGKDLDSWFSQLVENLREYEMSQQVQELETSQSELNNDFQTFTPQTEIQSSILGTPGAPPVDISQQLSQIPETHRVKEVKQPDINPSELAAQMAKQREQHDESLQDNRPFM